MVESRYLNHSGRVVKLVYTTDSKSVGLTTVRVQVPPRPPEQKIAIRLYFLFCIGGIQNLKSYRNPKDYRFFFFTITKIGVTTSAKAKTTPTIATIFQNI